MLEFEGTRKGRRRGSLIAVVFVVIGLIVYLLPAAYQTPIRETLRRTLLRPFVVAQSKIDTKRLSARELVRVRAQRDSLLAVAAAQAALSEENRQMRALLGLSQRAPDRFVTAQLLRVGVGSPEGTFLLDVGSEDGVEVGSPVIAAEGLLGIVNGVDPRSAQAIDWSHSGFHVSVMTADGDAYGILEPRPGRFREEDLLVLTGPFHADIAPGTLLVTSGQGLYPRGVPVGTIIGIEEADTGWRKTYLVRPAIRPESARHVLVAVAGQERGELSDLWQAVPALPAAPGGGAADSARIGSADAVSGA